MRRSAARAAAEPELTPDGGGIDPDMELDADDAPAKRRPWGAHEDEHLRQLVEVYGIKSWAQIATQLNNRNGKQCRERWRNHLRPELNKGDWTTEEDIDIWERVQEMGTKWAQVRSHAFLKRVVHETTPHRPTYVAARRSRRCSCRSALTTISRIDGTLLSASSSTLPAASAPRPQRQPGRAVAECVSADTRPCGLLRVHSWSPDENKARADVLGAASRTTSGPCRARAGVGGERKRQRVIGTGSVATATKTERRKEGASYPDSLGPAASAHHGSPAVEEDDNSPNPGRKLFESPEAVVRPAPTIDTCS